MILKFGFFYEVTITKWISFKLYQNKVLNFNSIYISFYNFVGAVTLPKESLLIKTALYCPLIRSL